MGKRIKENQKRKRRKRIGRLINRTRKEG